MKEKCLEEKKTTYKTPACMKNRYNNKAYNRINLTVKKGNKDIIKHYAESCGLSVNSFINSLIADYIFNYIK